MKKFLKENVTYFLIIFIFSVIMCNGFIRMHYTTDTYKIADEGYMNYAENWSLKDGRVFMYGFLSICNSANLHIETVNYIFTTLGLAISCIAVVLIKNMVLNLKDEETTIFSKIIVTIMSYFVIFNFMYIEAIYFLEIIIISMSILLYTLAVKCIIENKKMYFLKALIYTILGIFCYQGTITFFIVLGVAMILMKNRKISVNFFKEGFSIGIITILALGLDILGVKLICKYLELSQTRFGRKSIIQNFNSILENLDVVLINSCGLLRKYWYIGIVGSTFLLNIIYLINTNEKIISCLIRFLLLTACTIIGPFGVFLATSSSIDCGRMYIILGGLPSLMFIFSFVNSENCDEKSTFKKVLVGLLMIWAVINICTYFIRINESRQKNELEAEYCDKLVRYFQERGIEPTEGCIVRLELGKDYIYFDDIKTKNKMTSNEVRGYESAISGFNINTGYKIVERKDLDFVIQKYTDLIESGDTGIEKTYVMCIYGVLVMPAFIW